MKNTANSIIRILVIPVVLIMVILAASWLYMNMAASRAEERAFRVLEESATEQIATLNTALEGRFRTLEAFATSIMSTTFMQNSDRETVDMVLRMIIDSKYFSGACLIGLDGTGLFSNGEIVELGDREYFKQSLAGKNAVERLIGRSSGELRYTMSVPLFLDGEVVGVLCGTVQEEDFRSVVVSEVYNRQGFSFVSKTSNGLIVIGSDHDQINASAGDNIFDIFAGLEFLDGYSYQQMLDEIEDGKNGFAVYKINGEKRYVVYNLTTISDWVLFNVVSGAVVGNAVKNALNDAYWPALIIIVSSILLLIFVFLLDRHNRKIVEEEREEFKAAVSQSGREMMRYDIQTNTGSYVDLETTKQYSKVIPDYINQAIQSGDIHEDSIETFKDFYQKMKDGQETGEADIRVNRPDGTTGWVHLDYTMVKDSRGIPVMSVVSNFDNTDVHEMELAYEQWQNELNTMLGDSLVFLEANLTLDRVERVENFSDYLLQLPFSQAIFVIRDKYIDHQDFSSFIEFFRNKRLVSLYDSGTYSDEMECRAKVMVSDVAEIHWMSVRIRLVKDPYLNQLKVFLSAVDIQEEHEKQSKLAVKASIDSVTHLYNRETVEEKIRLSLNSLSADALCAMYLLDLDNFKTINDSKGHLAGDRSLTQISALLTQLCGHDILVGRFGGDEFMLFKSDFTSVDEIEQLAFSLTESLQYWYEDILITVSIGISICKGRQKTFEELYMQSDTAMYRAKKNGRCGYVTWKDHESTSLVQSDRETQLSLLMENIDGGIVMAQVKPGDNIRDISITYISPIFRKLTNSYDDDFNVLMQRLVAMVYPEDRAPLFLAIHDTALSGKVNDLVFRIGQLGNERRQFKFVQFKAEIDGSASVLGILSDISEREKTLEQLQISEERYKNALHLLKVSINEIDLVNKSLIISPEMSAYFGLDGTTFFNMPEGTLSAGLVHPDSVSDYRAMYERLYQGMDNQWCIVKMRDATGKFGWVQVQCKILKNRFGVPTRAIATVNVLPNVERQMEQFNKLVQLSNILDPVVIGSFIINLSKDMIEKHSMMNSFSSLSSDTYSAFHSHMWSCISDDPESLACCEQMRIERLIEAYQQEKECLFMEFRVNQPSARWVGMSVYLTRHPISGDLYGFGFQHDSEKQHRWAAKLADSFSLEASRDYYDRKSFSDLFDVAVEEMRDDRYCTLTCVGIVGMDRLRVEKGLQYAQSVMLNFSQLCSSMVSGDVLSTIWDDQNAMVFRTNVVNPALHFLRATEHRSRLLSFITQVADVDYLDVVIGYALSDKESKDFASMAENAFIACKIARHWPESPVVPFADLDAEMFEMIENKGKMSVEQRQVIDSLLLQQSVQPHAVEYDALTGLCTHQSFCNMVRDAIDKDPTRSYRLLRWDVDNFKLYNDGFGVEAGNKLLQFIAYSALSFVDESVPIARLVSDHFIMLLTDQPESFDEAFLKKMSSALLAYSSRFHLSLHMGVYHIDDCDVDVSSMCDKTYLALSSKKNDFVNCIGYYNEELQRQVFMEHRLVGEFSNALQTDQFEVYLQPQYDFSTKEIIGAEALVRWNHPDLGQLMPSSFIALLERNGMITDLDQYVWTKSCSILAKWLGSCPEKVVPLSVNVSRVDLFHPQICDIFAKLLSCYSLSPKYLKLEITENDFIDDSAKLIEIVKKFQAMGFKVEMDDFGTGASSLNMLKDIPVNTLKLDMRLLDGVGVNKKDEKILGSIISMANLLELAVIAEGVETLDQARHLYDLQCAYMQGFYFAKPMPIAEFERLMGLK